MKRTKQDRKRNRDECAISDQESFPYGLRISLDDESLSKLGIKELPGVGEAYIVVGVGKVSSVSENSNERRTNRNVSIQLEKLEVGPLKSGKLGPIKTAEDAVTAAIKEV
jgi:hypothetical protein